MAGIRTPSYFGSLYDAEDPVFSRQVLGARQGLTGQQGQISSFADAQRAQVQQMDSLRQLAQTQAGQQQQQLQQSANTAQSAAERARQDAIAEQNAKLQRSQWQAEFDARNAQTQEQLQLQRDQEARRQYLNTPQPIYADYSNVPMYAGGGGGARTSPYDQAIANGMSPIAALQYANQQYASRVGQPGSNVYVVGYQRPQQ